LQSTGFAGYSIFLLKNSRTILLSFPVRRRALQNYTDLPASVYIGIIAKLRLMRESAIIILRYFNKPLKRMDAALMRDDAHPENN
jgi:hypothetical protein